MVLFGWNVLFVQSKDIFLSSLRIISHNTSYVRGIHTIIMLKSRKVDFLQYKHQTDANMGANDK